MCGISLQCHTFCFGQLPNLGVVPLCSYLHVTGTLPKNTSTGVGPEELSASTVDNLLKSTFADKRGGGGMGTARGGGNSSSAALSPPTTHKPADDGTEDDLPNTDGGDGASASL